jgi:hypothetical protein
MMSGHIRLAGCISTFEEAMFLLENYGRSIDFQHLAAEGTSQDWAEIDRWSEIESMPRESGFWKTKREENAAEKFQGEHEDAK